MIREAFATGALVVALIASYEVKRAHDLLAAERAYTERLVRALHQRLHRLEQWHGWPPTWDARTDPRRKPTHEGHE